MAQAFSFEVDAQGIAVLRMDMPGEKVNKLSRSVMVEVEDFFKRVEGDSNIRGVVLISAKEDNFIVGADINEFLEIKSSEEARLLSRKAQEALSRFEKLKTPVVAAIHGACLGGGLEVAMACHYRIASDDPKTVLGLPEVQLGIIPAAAGTQRLPRLVGVEKALDLILTGRHTRAKRARKMGLVDEIVQKDILLEVAKKAARDLAAGVLKPKRESPSGLRQFLLEKNPLGRNVVFNKAREEVLKKTHGHYPAPLKALEAIKIGVESGLEKGLEAEARFFGEAAVSEVSRQLVNLFFAINAVKKDPVIQNTEIRPKEVKRLGIVGAGFMGAGIATVAADVGVTVRLRDKDDESLGRGLKACYDYFHERARRGSIDRLEMQRKLDLISGACEYTGFSRADLVIEAVFEDLAIKQKVVQEVEAVAAADCVFASNTSALPITEIAKAARRPENVIGMHFFSPVPKMPLLEIIVTKQTSEQTVATALEFGRRLGKTTIVVNDGVGFYTSRILGPYMNEASHLLYEGAAIDDIDQAMLDFGFPVGPIALLDEVGIDVAAKVAKIMYETYGARMEPPAGWQRILEAGRFGRKNKRGFYTYDGKKQVDQTVYDLMPHGRNRKPFPREEIQQRLALAMINEAALCLEEGILRNPRDGDVGAIMGLGFPPFRGGPFRYVDAIGVQNVLDSLQKLRDRFGARFSVAQIIADMARNGEKFRVLMEPRMNADKRG
jgi:3-hydroxyacyl-CoA dehydrogenase/enoyl-CoA hydratase/3-hydroxybutyryl-CoA epimerase